MDSDLMNGNRKYPTAIFDIIRSYHQLNLSDFLKILISNKAISLKDLHQQLYLRDYYINLESLYRYFNHNPHSNRLPPQEFIQVFAEVIKLTAEETKLLLKFWWCCKSGKKSCHQHNCPFG